MEFTRAKDPSPKFTVVAVWVDRCGEVSSKVRAEFTDPALAPMVAAKMDLQSGIMFGFAMLVVSSPDDKIAAVSCVRVWNKTPNEVYPTSEFFAKAVSTAAKWLSRQDESGGTILMPTGDKNEPKKGA